jgi:hypothetical protein
MVPRHPSSRALSTDDDAFQLFLQRQNFKSIDHVQQNISPTDNPPLCTRRDGLERHNVETTTRVANELSPSKSAYTGDVVLQTSTRGTVHMGQYAGLLRTASHSAHFYK